MFNKAKKERKKEISSYKKERNSRLYNGWDIGKSGPDMVTRDGVTYYLDWPTHHVVDHYDPNLSSSELSHQESVGYAVVDGYKGDTDTLDFTFIRPQDEVAVTCDENIKTIKINATNLRYSSIKATQPLDIKVVVDTGKIDRWFGLKTFTERHKDIIKSVSFVSKEDELKDMLDDSTSNSLEKEDSKTK